MHFWYSWSPVWVHLVIILIKRDDTRGIESRGLSGVDAIVCLEAVPGARFFGVIPEIAALPDTRIQAGEGANGGGMVWHVPVPLVVNLISTAMY